MFSPEVVERKLDSFEESFGWRPKPSSISDVDAAISYLSSAFEIDAKSNILQTRDLTRAEHAFVANERAMCMASCLYFLTRYYWIKTRNRIQRFAFRQGQWILWLMLCELDRLGVSKMLQILKARQLGISTLAEGIATWASLFIPGVASQIGSADGQKTQVMLGMMLLAIDQLPPWLPPTQTRSKSASDRAMLEYSRIGSLIMVQPGSMRGGMGQGATPTFVHLSEVSQYTNPVVQLEEGLFKALHEGPELIVMLESTGDAKHQSAWWWKEQWIANRDNYWQGAARFLPVFLPWHTTPELYPGPGFLKKFPMPEGWTPNEDTRSHMLRAETYVKTTAMLNRVLGANWTMPLEQQWFWEFNHEDHKRRRVEKSWYRQMPSDDYEALLGENDKTYTQDTLNTISETLAKHEETGVYSLVGDGIPERHEPQDPDVWYGEDSPPRLKTTSTNPRSLVQMEWMFVPLKHTKELDFNPLEKFLIYEEPQKDYDYAIGCDTGTGVGGDRSSIIVSRYGTGEEPDFQVAEFASDAIPADKIHLWIAAASRFYGRFYTDRTRYREPKICIEMRRKFGDLPYHLLREMGFRRWHKWGHGFDRQTFQEHPREKFGRVGWFTNEWSRPLLLTAFQGAVDGGWYVVRSKYLMSEMETHEQRTTASGKTRSDHESGGHDDRLFAAAQSYFTMHQRDVLSERDKKRYAEPDDGGIEVDIGPSKMVVELTGI